ncbi:protein SRC2-like [Tasmannia lanceolata]|uniref:protein SRC2-like n=1 Tax=Tasmannia lanceolata TaxID=3420 RepID=UPI004064AAD0
MSRNLMDLNSIELKVMSCKGLKSCNFFQKLSAYVSAGIGTGDRDKKNRKQKQKTPVNRDGGANPEWNHDMKFDFDDQISSSSDQLFLEFDLLCDGILSDKTVGEVKVPISDLVAESNGAVRFVSYEIRSSDGKANGVLNFSYKVNLKGTAVSDVSRATYTAPAKVPEKSVPAIYPPVYFPAEEQKPWGGFYPTIHDMGPETPPAIGYFPPPAKIMYFPPAPPHPPPDPYGFQEGGYGYPVYGYPIMEQSQPYNHDMWRWDVRNRGSAGYLERRW